MGLSKMRKLLWLFAASVWLPAVVTCDPGIVRIVGVPTDIIVVDEDYYDDDDCCGWGDFHFGWWDDDDDDDDD